MEPKPPFITVPWYDADTNTWSHRTFSERQDFAAFVWSCFKEPGLYEFDETSSIFNTEARKFKKDGVYTEAPFGSKDYRTYWDTQKERCRRGILVTSGDKTLYLPREYYMWLNFLPIFHKEKKEFTFPEIRDAQYHMALYELLAELEWKHASILKKRQIASSYYHAAKLINGFSFEAGFVGKMGASLKDYINEKGTWLFLQEYANFLDTHTAWYRPRQPDKVFTWLQQIEVTMNGRKNSRGLKSRLTGMSFEKDPTNGVGGPCSIFFHEEGGIAPKADKTYEYIRPAMQSGHVTTGIFVIAGSVGDLDQCEPLKEFILRPETNGFLGVETDLLDENNTRGTCGLFIPEQWSMPPYIDPFGNSLVKEALEAIAKLRKLWKFGDKDKKIDPLPPEQFQLRVSQSPINIKEAFDFRTESKFPTHLIQQQMDRIDQKVYPYELLDLKRTLDGKLEAVKSNRVPINVFPVPKALPGKEGALVVWERPIAGSPWGTYYGSIDPVGEGKTTTSDSLCSIYIYKNPIEVTKIAEDGTRTVTIENDGLVAAWCGRYDDLNDTHDLLAKIIEWYNAWTIVEANVSLFIQYMISKRKQKYLVPKDQIVFLKELGANTKAHHDIGWKNTGTFFKDHLINYPIEYCKEKINKEYDENGEETAATYGVVRIPDPMLLKEMMAYRDGVNVDRLVSFTALIAFAKMQISNRGYAKITEHSSSSLKTAKDIYKVTNTPFRHIGNKNAANSQYKRSRSAFKNMR